MNYLLHYNILIDNARNRNWSKQTAPCYTERHHIVPKSVGGTNDPSNIVCLTAKEHFVAHHLLFHIHTGDSKKKMAFAWFNMCTSVNGRATIASSTYQRVKSIAAIYRRDYSIHTFYNIATKEQVTMAAYDFKLKYKINPSPLYKTVNACSRNWCVLTTDTDIAIIEKARCHKGARASRHKEEVFPFFHHDHGLCILTRFAFKEKSNISPQAISDLVYKRNIVVKGWQIWDFLGPPRPTNTYTTRGKFGIKNSSADLTIYTFVNDTTTYTGYRSEFIRMYKLNKSAVSSLVQGKRKDVQGWSLIKNYTKSPPH